MLVVTEAQGCTVSKLHKVVMRRNALLDGNPLHLDRPSDALQLSHFLANIGNIIGKLFHQRGHCQTMKNRNFTEHYVNVINII